MEIKILKKITFLLLFLLWLFPFSGSAQTDPVLLEEPVIDCLGADARVELSWVSTLGGTPTYFILRKLEGEAVYTEIDSTTNTYYTDDSVDSDKRYNYQIRAEKGGDTYFSNEVLSVAAYCPPQLLAPTASCGQDGPNIDLSWIGISGDLQTYEIYRNDSLIYSTTDSSYQDGPNITGTENYEYFIRAVWQNNTSADSATTTIEAPACPPTLSLSSGCLSALPGGPQYNLSWNDLLGVQQYQVYRRAQAETEFSLLEETTENYFDDNLVNTLPGDYYQSGNVSYYVRAVWETDQENSDIKTMSVPRCNPFLRVESNCDEFSMRLFWTATMEASHYNIYRNGEFIDQVSGTGNVSYVDYLSPTNCPGEICTHTYYVEAVVTGLGSFDSNSVQKSIDCSTIEPPSPAPVLDDPVLFCDTGDSQIGLSWSPSDNVNYYSVFRNGNSIVNLPDTSYTDSGVQSGYEYTYYIVAVGEGETATSSNSHTVTAVECLPPSVPALNLSAGCVLGNPVVDLSWSETNNTLSYDVYRGLAQDSLNLLVTFEEGSPEFSSRSWRDNGVSSSTNYYYKIVANGPEGVTPAESDVESVFTSSCYPTAPTLSLSPRCENGQARMDLSWTSDEAYTDHYEIFREDYLGGTAPIYTTSNSSEKNWTDDSVTLSTAYRYKVEAVSPSGKRATQGYRSETTGNCLPTVPSISLSAYCENGQARVRVSWSTDEANTDHYEVFRRDYSETNPIYTTSGSSEKNWVDDTVSLVTNYEYKVEAVGPAGRSTEGYDSINTGNCLPTTPSLSLNTYCSGGLPRVELNWSTNENNTSYYDVYREDQEPAPVYTTSGSSEKSWTDTTVAMETTYRYRVEAVGPAGTSSSAYQQITTYNCNPPADFTFNNPTVYCQGPYPWADLDWGDSFNFDYYDLYRDHLDPGGSVLETETFHDVSSPFTDKGFGNALSFDGNDYVEIGNPVLPTGDFTVEAWVRLDSNNDETVLMASNGGGGNELLLLIRYGELNTYVDNRRVMTGSIGILTDVWNHIVVTRSGSTVTQYINTAQDDQGSEGDSLNFSDCPLFLGIDVDSGCTGGLSNRLNGRLDEVRIYGRALSPAEITEHYGGIYNNENGLLGLWHLDEGAGQITSDSSNAGRDGVLGGSESSESSDPSWVVHHPEALERYTWQAEAFGIGGSTLSNEVGPETMPLCSPAKPGLLLTPLCNSTTSEIEVDWSFSINADHYEVYRDGGLIETVSDPLDTILIDSNLEYGRNYTYWVIAVGSGGLTSESDHLSAVATDCSLPSPPQNLTATFACAGSYPYISLNWDASAGAYYYNVYRDGIHQVNTTDTFYDDSSGVNVDTTYSYYVNACAPGGCGDPSAEITTTTGFCVPSQPSIIDLDTYCVSQQAEVEVSWSDPTTFNTSYYEIYRDSSLVKTVNPSDPEFSSRNWNDVGLADETEYTYQVKSIGPAGESPYSNPESVTTPFCQPPAPSSLNLYDRCTNSNNPITLLHWDLNPKADEYEIYKDGGFFSDFTPTGFIRHWLLIGPFDNPGHPDCVGYDTDYIDELNVRPRAGETVGGETWFDYTSSGDFINFDNIFSPNEYVVSYAFAYIYSASEKDVQLRLGSDDGVKAFLNGAVVHDNHVHRGASTDQDIVNIHLNQGINHLLIKVDEGWGGWGFYARITDASGNNALTEGTYWDSNVSSGASSDYYIVSRNVNGGSGPSNTVSSNPQECLPAKPNLVVSPQCTAENPELQLSWGLDPNDLTNYWSIYKRRTGDPIFEHLGNVAPPTVSYTDGNVESGVNYEYYVEAVGSVETIPSDAINEDAPFCYGAPSKPVIKSAAPVCYGYGPRIKLEWDEDPSGNTISFNVWRKATTSPLVSFSQIESGL
ncbi:MAG: hypothetical protein GF370_00510, partial [Candidatus Nealsonbacteria bacterium]|nr:hypothetical protein [Candidatus Nealsonbacteria bacterium]